MTHVSKALFVYNCSFRSDSERRLLDGERPGHILEFFPGGIWTFWGLQIAVAHSTWLAALWLK